MTEEDRSRRKKERDREKTVAMEGGGEEKGKDKKEGREGGRGGEKIEKKRAAYILG